MSVTINGDTGVSKVQDGAVESADLAASVKLGKVLQVVSTLFTAQGSTTITTSDTATNPAITHTITPIGNGSKFRIDIRWFGETTEAENATAHVHRNGARINEANSSNNHGLSMVTLTYGAGSNNDSTPEMLTLSTLDTTGSTAGVAITYALRFSAASSNTMWTNRCFGPLVNYYETGVSEIIIMEIGA
jgi:hypothetical protein